jgi:type III restriction enzyme
MPEKSALGYDQLPGLEDRDPYSKPTAFLRKPLGTEELELVPERRPSEMLVVNRLREAVDAWRDTGYEGASATTRELFRWWFEEADTAGFRPYWAQREAVETIAYLIEVSRLRDVKELIDSYQAVPDPNLLEHGIDFQTTPDGVRQVVRRKQTGGVDTISLPPADLARYALKMATGTGKTLVMALVVVWSYFHARREPGSPLSTNFLILAPNVIVFERLRSDFENGFVFHELPLVPPGWQLDLQVILRGESTEPVGGGSLFLTNIQQLYEGASEWTPKNALDRLLGRKPTGDPAQGRRMLERVRDLDSLVVMNDEAHHVHDEDLKWNQTLMSLHRSLPRGLALWLDLSATPKFQSGVYFPWIVCDYPLAQAVEDRIVKSPVILRMVNRADPEDVTRTNVIDKYRDWLVAGVGRLHEHQKQFEGVGAKPVLFVMSESIQHADRIGEWLCDPGGGGLKSDEVLVIHTKNNGEISVDEKKLEQLRRQAREIDDPDSPIKVVVSVLVLREGWDVRNVTVVLGLRPGTATARILPEQAVGRGLRLMRHIGPDTLQVLEVIGTPGFENFVRQLEAEGVHLPTETKAPPPPVTVTPTKERLEFDIEIPRTGTSLARVYKRVEELDVSALESVFDVGDVGRLKALRLQAEAAVHEVSLGEVSVDRLRPPLSTEIVAAIVNRTQRNAGLTSEFATLVPRVRAYLVGRCFGEAVDIDSEVNRVFLAEPEVQETIARYLAARVGELVTETKPIAVEGTPIRLSDTQPFHWRRNLPAPVCAKTVFNYVATFNPFETSFAEFADGCEDVARFAALAETYTGFWVDYVKPSGATGRYFPDWVVVQKVDDREVNWIVETKGRVWEGTDRKDAAIRYWCEQVTASSGESWNYIRVDQPIFKPETLGSFAELVSLIEQRAAVVEQQVIVVSESLDVPN